MTSRVEARGVERLRRYDDLICALVRGETIAWPGAEHGEEVEGFLARAEYHGMLPLLDDRFRDPLVAGQWPEAIRERCRADALAWVAWDLAQRGDTARLLAAFRGAQLKPLILKGAALACSHYAHPGLRPRSDLDLLVPEAVKEPAEKLLRSLGYFRQGVPMGRYVSHQSTWSLVNRQGASHDVDLHWRSNNSPTLAKLLGYEEMVARAVGVPALGPHAFAPCAIDALLFACIHRTGHTHAPMYVDGVAEPAKDRLIWLYDIYLLASRMSAPELEESVSLALKKRAAEMTWEALELCEGHFGLDLPDFVRQELSRRSVAEPSSQVFRGGRLRQLAGDLLELDGRERIGWLREMAFPSPQYIRSKYPDAKPSWLPVLYIRRAYSGLRKALLN